MTKKELNRKIYVTTYPENGWDCVGSVYIANNEEQIKSYIEEEQDCVFDEDQTIIHKKYEIIDLADALNIMLMEAFEAGRTLKSYEPIIGTGVFVEPEISYKYNSFKDYLKKLDNLSK
jgi:hypothetical protein